VDDGGIIGTSDSIKELISALGRSFKVQNTEEMEYFVGCEIMDRIDKDGVWIHPPKLLKNLNKNIKKVIGDTARIFKTPSAPKTLIICPTEGDPLISPEKQKNFKMGVGMLLYLVKHSWPDISNSIREISKVADGATEGNFKARQACHGY
jgi:hypothetical protein